MSWAEQAALREPSNALPPAKIKSLEGLDTTYLVFLDLPSSDVKHQQVCVIYDNALKENQHGLASPRCHAGLGNQWTALEIFKDLYAVMHNWVGILVELGAFGGEPMGAASELLSACPVCIQSSSPSYTPAGTIVFHELQFTSYQFSSVPVIWFLKLETGTWKLAFFTFYGIVFWDQKRRCGVIKNARPQTFDFWPPSLLHPIPILYL